MIHRFTVNELLDYGCLISSEQLNQHLHLTLTTYVKCFVSTSNPQSSLSVSLRSQDLSRLRGG